MPLAVADILEPNGPVQPAWFPGEGDGSLGTALHTRLTAYLTQAYAKAETVAATNPDAAALAWVEHRVYGYLCRQQAGTGPLKSVDVKDSVAYSYGEAGKGSADWCALAEGALTDYQTATTGVRAVPQASRVVPVTFSF